MTPAQFEALAKLLGLRGGPSAEAARLVLVDGVSVTEAAARTGVSQPGVSNAVARCRKGLELARAVVDRHDGEAATLSE